MTYEASDNWDMHDAIAAMNGHIVTSPNAARRVCELLGVEFDETLVFSWESEDDALDRFGFFPTDSGAGSGVNGLDLSYHVCEKLGIKAPGHTFVGDDMQARVNQQAITKKLEQVGWIESKDVSVLHLSN